MMSVWTFELHVTYEDLSDNGIHLILQQVTEGSVRLLVAL